MQVDSPHLTASLTPSLLPVADIALAYLHQGFGNRAFGSVVPERQPRNLSYHASECEIMSCDWNQLHVVVEAYSRFHVVSSFLLRQVFFIGEHIGSLEVLFTLKFEGHTQLSVFSIEFHTTSRWPVQQPRRSRMVQVVR